MVASQKTQFKEIHVSNVIEILTILRQYPGLSIFRGQSNVKWPLIPKIARLFGHSNVLDTWERLEGFILDDFRKFSVPHIKREPKNHFEWLVTGQHYGLPTRLLDWTTNPLKATFFAAWENVGKMDGALFALSPTSLIPMLGDDENIDFSHMMPVFPNMIDTRIVAQESCFTVFPLPADKKGFKPLEDVSSYQGDYFLLLKMIIPCNKKADLLRDLNFLGVNRRTLFPDLTGLSEQISWDVTQNQY